jgi:hypothetical protein
MSVPKEVAGDPESRDAAELGLPMKMADLMDAHGATPPVSRETSDTAP